VNLACYGGSMKRLIPIVLTPLFAACAADTTNYPTLARRDAEKVVEAARAVPVSSPESDPGKAELTTRLAGLTDQASVAHGRFESRRANADSTVAAGSSVGSESWAVASVALADLESARSDVMIALADLDEIYAAQRVAGRDVSAITKARDVVIALVKEEDQALAQLRNTLNRR
jgi:hypothetical protein